MELEQGKNVDFWRDMTTITEDEISKLRKLEASGKGPGTIFPILLILFVVGLTLGRSCMLMTFDAQVIAARESTQP